MAGLRIRDDFDGALGANLLDRVPNITSTGETWQSPSLGSLGDWWELQLNGAGSAAAVEQPGSDAGEAWASLDFPATTSLVLKFGARAADGVSDIHGFSGSRYVALNGSIGAASINIRFFRTFVRCLAPSLADIAHAEVGLGGALVEAEIRWGDGVFEVVINDVVIYSGAMAAPSGAGSVEFATTGENAFTYIELASLDPVESVPFWTGFVGTREQP